MASTYLLSQAASNLGGTPEVFNWIVLDVLMKKFDIQVDEDIVTLHSDIVTYQTMPCQPSILCHH